MSQMSQSPNAADVEWLKRTLKRLKVSQLRELARSTRCGLGKLKADTLQNLFNVVDLLQMAGNSNGIIILRLLTSLVQSYTALPPFRAIMEGVENGSLNLQYLIHQMSSNQMPTQFVDLITASKQNKNPNPLISGYRQNPMNLLVAQSLNNSDIKITFEQDSFHTQLANLSNFPQIGSGTAHSKCEMYLKCRLTKEERELLHSHENNGLFLYCAKLPDNGVQTSDFRVEYPQKMELQVNGVVITDLSYRGFKNEVGSAKPVNLSKYIKSVDTLNTVKFTFVAAAKYILYVKICRKFTGEELFKSTKFPHIPIEEDRTRIRRNFQNEDGISIDVEKISLNCPITYGRIQVPMRSVNCDHLACFDGLSFLALQEQVSTWKCPFCQTRTLLNDLRISEYFTEVLKSVSDHTETVSIGSDCKWTELDFFDDMDLSDEEKAPVSSSAVNHKETSTEGIEEIIILDSDEEEEAQIVPNSEPVETQYNISNNKSAPIVDIPSSSQSTHRQVSLHDVLNDEEPTTESPQDADIAVMENDILNALEEDSDNQQNTRTEQQGKSPSEFISEGNNGDGSLPQDHVNINSTITNTNEPLQQTAASSNVAHEVSDSNPIMSTLQGDTGITNDQASQITDVPSQSLSNQNSDLITAPRISPAQYTTENDEVGPKDKENIVLPKIREILPYDRVLVPDSVSDVPKASGSFPSTSVGLNTNEGNHQNNDLSSSVITDTNALPSNNIGVNNMVSLNSNSLVEPGMQRRPSTSIVKSHRVNNLSASTVNDNPTTEASTVITDNSQIKDGNKEKSNNSIKDSTNDSKGGQSSNAFNFRYTHNDRRFVHENQITLLRNKIERYNQLSNPASNTEMRDEELESEIRISNSTEASQHRSEEDFDLTHSIPPPPPPPPHHVAVIDASNEAPRDAENIASNRREKNPVDKQIHNDVQTNSPRKHPLESNDDTSMTPNKKNRTYGMLGLVLDDDEDFSVSPLNGKIGEMSISTPQSSRLQQ